MATAARLGGQRGGETQSLRQVALASFIGIDDGPFLPSHRGDVALVGAVFTKTRLAGRPRSPRA